MRYWRYKAIDQNEVISEGLYDGDINYIELIVDLRQQGLQIIDLYSISKIEYDALKKLKNLNNLIDPPSKPIDSIRNKRPRLFIIAILATISSVAIVAYLLFLKYHQ